MKKNKELKFIERKKYLYTIYKAIKKNNKFLAKLENLETGKNFNDAKKEIHKIVLKASNENKQSSTIEFFVKVHENPKIKN